MKRAKLPAMRRNAAVVLGSVGTVDDIDVLTRAIHDAGARVRLAAGACDVQRERASKPCDRWRGRTLSP